MSAILAVVTFASTIFAVTTALSASLAAVTASAPSWSVVTWLSSMCCVRIALFAISADTIVPFTILAEVTELSAIAEAVPVKFPVTLPTKLAAIA